MSQPKKPAPKPGAKPKPATSKPAAKSSTAKKPPRPAKGGSGAKPAGKGPAPKGTGAHKSAAPKPQNKAPAAAPSAGGSRLVALVDGRPLGESEARALWGEFSSYLEEHELDFAGFAASKGWRSVKPEHRAGRAVLVVESA